MPTRELYRIWCKKCNEFELHEHHYPDWENWFCCECKTQYTEVYLKDIPEEKKKEQRERYKRKNREEMNKLFSGYLFEPYHGLFLSPEENINIRESDAGQRAIDEEEKRIRDEKYEKRRQIKEENRKEVEKYKELGRNDECICGSGKKYKKCCLDRIRTITIEYNV